MEQIKEVCLNLFVFFVASSSRPNLQTDVNNWPPKVEFAGGVRMIVFFVSLPA
jgi:hypothetical protein